jgi:pyruvate dehydrogenase E1 component alpha subunit
LLFWEKRDPLKRFRQFLFDQNILDESSDTKLVEEVEEELAEQIKLAYDYPLPRPDTLFDNVYGDLTPRLERQREVMRREITSF